MSTKELINRLRAMYVEHGTNHVQAAADKLEAQAEYIRELEDAVTPELKRLAKYDELLTAVMPPNFKDWHENSRNEWPEIAAWVITNLRKQCDEVSKDAERYQWLRRTQVELSLSNETIAGLVRSVGDLDAAIDAQKGTA